MSSKCDYVYVQGLRFRTKDIVLVWKNSSGSEQRAGFHKTGLGRPPLNQYGNPASLSPKELKKMLRKGETIDAYVYVREPGSSFPTKVNLKLDPWAAEGRKGRNSFTPDALENMQPHERRLLALMQLQTAPYGRENRDQAVERILWSLENLTDEDLASMLRLPTENDPAREVSSSSHLLSEDRSSTPAELAALLFSDEHLIRSLLHSGSHDSLRRLSYLSMVAPALLDGTPTSSAEDIYERVALEAFDPESVSSSAARRNALRYIYQADALEKVLLTDEDPEVRIDAATRLKVRGDIQDAGRAPSPAFLAALQSDPSPEVRLKALEYVSDDVAVTGAAMTDEDPQVRLKAVELIGDESDLLRVAELATNPETSKAAYDRAFTRITHGTYLQMRMRGRIVPTPGRNANLATELAGSADPAVLERLVDTLTEKSGSSRANDLTASIMALSSLGSNASADEALRSKASATATALSVALHEAHAREERERVERKERDEFTKASIAYERRKYEFDEEFRRMRARRVYSTRPDVITAIAAGATDPEDIRVIVEVVQSFDSQVWGNTPIVSALRLNPATPPDVLEKLPPKGLTFRDARNLENSSELRKLRAFQEQILGEHGLLLRSGPVSAHAERLAERSLDLIQLTKLFDAASTDPAEYPIQVMEKLAANPHVGPALATKVFEFASTMDRQAAGSLLKALAANPATPQDVRAALLTAS
jgi:hypothetical protein